MPKNHIFKSMKPKLSIRSDYNFDQFSLHSAILLWNAYQLHMTSISFVPDTVWNGIWSADPVVCSNYSKKCSHNDKSKTLFLNMFNRMYTIS